MGWTKKDFIKTAYPEIGVPKRTISPDQYERGLVILDTMVAEWHDEGIYIGYPLAETPDDMDLATETDVPLTKNSLVWMNLAVKLGSAIGKTPLPPTVMGARKSYQNAKARVPIPEKQLPRRLPIGSGNKPLALNTNEFFRPQTETPPDVDNQEVEGI